MEQQIEEIVVDDDFDLDMDFSKTKKKKKKKKDLDELVAEEERKETEDKENGMYHTKWFMIDIFLYRVVYVTHYLLTCCTESERSAEYGKTYVWCFLTIEIVLDYLSIVYALAHNEINTQILVQNLVVP